MKKNISILVAVIGVFAGRALARQGNADMEVIVLILAALPVLSFGVYVYKKTHTWFFLIGGILLFGCLPFINKLGDIGKVSHVMFFGAFSVVFFAFCMAIGCLFTGCCQISPNAISRKKWKYCLIGLALTWGLCCGGVAAVLFLLEPPNR